MSFCLEFLCKLISELNKDVILIAENHEKEIKQLGFEVEDFIPIVMQYGSINIKKSETHKKVYGSKHFRFVIALDKKNQKQWLLTAFDLRKKPNYKKHRRL